MANTTPTLAVALIVKNEAKHLQACLDTVYQWVDEIVILDSGSSDQTEAIARRYTDKFFVNTEWPRLWPSAPFGAIAHYLRLCVVARCR